MKLPDESRRLLEEKLPSGVGSIKNYIKGSILNRRSSTPLHLHRSRAVAIPDFAMRNNSFQEGNEKQSRSVPESKSLNMLDRVPMDFSETNQGEGTSFGRVITDPDEAKMVELFDDPAVIKSRIRQSQAEGLVPCAVYVAEPWFHQDVSREQAEHMLRQCKFKEGSFLVRVSKHVGTFVLSLAHKGCVCHVPVCIVTPAKNSNQSARLTVDSGKTVFRDLVQLIEFYQDNTSDVIPCVLTDYVTKTLKVPHSYSNPQVNGI